MCVKEQRVSWKNGAANNAIFLLKRITPMYINEPISIATGPVRRKKRKRNKRRCPEFILEVKQTRKIGKANNTSS